DAKPPLIVMAWALLDFARPHGRSDKLDDRNASATADGLACGQRLCWVESRDTGRDNGDTGTSSGADRPARDRHTVRGARSDRAMSMRLSVLIPIYNEVESLPELADRLTKALTQLGEPWEVVFADDGSSDGSGTLLDQMAAQEPRF